MRIILLGVVFSLLLGMQWVDRSYAVGETYMVRTDEALLKNQPSVQAETRKKLPFKTRVKRLDKQGEWYRVISLADGETGWLQRDDVERYVPSTSSSDLQAESRLKDKKSSSMDIIDGEKKKTQEDIKVDSSEGEDLAKTVDVQQEPATINLYAEIDELEAFLNENAQDLSEEELDDFMSRLKSAQISLLTSPRNNLTGEYLQKVEDKVRLIVLLKERLKQTSLSGERK